MKELQRAIDILNEVSICRIFHTARAILRALHATAGTLTTLISFALLSSLPPSYSSILSLLSLLALEALLTYMGKRSFSYTLRHSSLRSQSKLVDDSKYIIWTLIISLPITMFLSSRSALLALFIPYILLSLVIPYVFKDEEAIIFGATLFATSSLILSLKSLELMSLAYALANLTALVESIDEAERCAERSTNKPAQG